MARLQRVFAGIDSIHTCCSTKGERDEAGAVFHWFLSTFDKSRNGWINVAKPQRDKKYLIVYVALLRLRLFFTASCNTGSQSHT